MGKTLINQVAEKLGPMGVWHALRPFVPSLEEPQGSQVEVRALCPDHDDHRKSWCWNLAKGVAKCHVCGDGASFTTVIATHTSQKPVQVLDRFCGQLGLPRPRYRTLTLDSYAYAKAMPSDYLAKTFGMTNTKDGLLMPYLDRDGKVLEHRIRRRLGARPQWVGKGVKANEMVYGLHGLIWIANCDAVYVAEGESDLQVAWLHHLPALSIPGASINPERLARILAEISPTQVFLIPHTDKGGTTMLRKLDRALGVSGWSGALLVVRLPTNDLADMHCEAGANFDRAFQARVDRAKPADQKLEEVEKPRPEDLCRLTAIYDRLVRLRLTPNDLAIALVVARLALDNPDRPVCLNQQELANRAHLSRRTVNARLPGLVTQRIIRQETRGFFLGSKVVN